MSSNNQVLESPEEVLSTLSRDGKRRWLYPKLATGTLYRYRKLLGYLLIALYIALPFLRVDGKPVLLLDIINREFIVFGKSFFATDTLLFLLLILSILILIIALTAILGRVWCGWGCPQTVYLEFVFRPLEELIEGPPAQRKRRDEAPISFDKLWRKALKYLCFVCIAAVLANAFLAYFIGSDTLLAWMRLSPLQHPTPFGIMIFVTALVTFDFAYFREQMCTIACPYARLQSVLLDRDSRVVGYDSRRGEPRGIGRKREGLGDCVSCNQCVAACPTGIDIRNGLQLECIHCAQCIDACDAVMVKIGKPTGLVRYGSLNEFAGRPARFVRLRTILYFLVFAILVSTFVARIETRSDSRLQILRAAGAPYQLLGDGLVTNHVQLKIINMSPGVKTYSIEVHGTDEIKAVIPDQKFELASKEQRIVSMFINFPPSISNDNVLVRVSISGEESKELPYSLRHPKSE